jgi:hypothetical protein
MSVWQLSLAVMLAEMLVVAVLPKICGWSLSSALRMQLLLCLTK